MKNKRNIYLETVDIEQAQALYMETFSNLYTDRSETIPVYDSMDRVTAEPVFARISNPHYNASAMDGIALDASVTFGAHERNPLVLHEGRDFVYVDTGDCISDDHNAVIMIEDVYPNEDGSVRIMKAAYPWEHVRVVGEDIAVGDMILPSNHKIKPVDIGAVLSAGITEISVLHHLKVGILPTGTEIVSPGSLLRPGAIIDSNSSVFENMVKQAGGIPKRYAPVADDRKLLREAFIKAVEENDMVVINAGSSAGSEDYTAALIKELGEVYVHGIAIKPGKPTILGNINGKAVIGIPGYPVSAFLSFKAFVVPLIESGGNLQSSQDKKTAPVTLSKRVVSALKHKEYVRMKIGKVGDKLIGTPLSRGAGATMSLVKADGILEIPKNVEGLEAGTCVDVELLRPLKRIERALVSIGSHDIIMDHVNDMMKKGHTGYNLSSAHVGSLGGIMALKKGETHIAPVHLLDESTGDYNLSYIRKYLRGRSLYLVKGIKRQQGLYVRKGNPLGIQSLRDIADRDVIFANRQRGSGTRALLEFIMKQEKIAPETISGYEREFTTHTNVALAVVSGNAQVGLGIESVAHLMDLDFIPVASEDYDFVIPAEYIDLGCVKAFIDILGSQAFENKLRALGGYEISELQMWEVGDESCEISIIETSIT